MPSVTPILDAFHLHDWYKFAALALLLLTQLFKKAPMTRDIWAATPAWARTYVLLLVGGIAGFTQAFVAGLSFGDALMAFVGGCLGISTVAMGLNAALTGSHVPWNGGAGGKTLAALMLALATLGGVTACTPAELAQLVAFVAKVENAATQSALVVEQLQQDANYAFAAAPDTPLQQKVNAALGGLRDAIASVNKAADGTDAALVQKDVTLAARRFKEAWEAAQPVLEQAGLLKNGRPTARTADDASALQAPLLLRLAS